ncbi:MDR family MFS transporter [Agrococcus sp. Marseille-Q4369]|uniref:MDR family MFS transporter n=1 Tax=Agrococcus sp. Marseille-Q4369 TaxID=2810513 RepID=UPI001B8D61E2|nr:MDR family MFS transporter [Agrococcus sp. Marseille-Q4369]QUW18770.1 multidrug efflux MFS transporter [Agrococcus sp. Marseille-Q4369]
MPTDTQSTPARADASTRLPAGGAIVIATLLVSAFVVILNETAMNVAISTLVADPVLGIDERAAQWLTTAFLLTMAIVIPTTGWLMARFSTRSLYLVAMGAFVVGTLLAGVAPSFPLLLLGRVVQASGTAVVFPLLMTTVMRLVPPARRGAFMGTISLVMSVAPALGPTVSGAILQFASWRWIFLGVAPLAIAMLLTGARTLRGGDVQQPPRLDVVSIPLAGLGFGGLVYGLSLIGAEGLPAWQLPTALAIGALGLVAFVLRQVRLQRTDDALLDLRTFRHPLFTAAVTVMMIAMAAMFGTLILLPLILQDSLGLEPLQVGLITLPGALLTGLLGPVVGRLYDRWGPRPLVIPGALVVLAALVLYTQLATTTPWWMVLLMQMVLSLGFALTFPPLFTVSLGALPKHLYGHGSAVLSTVQQVAGAAGTAAFVTIMATRQAQLVETGVPSGDALLDGARIAFMGAAALWVLGVIATLRLRKPADDVPDEPEHREVAEEPAAGAAGSPGARPAPAAPAP